MAEMDFIGVTKSYAPNRLPVLKDFNLHIQEGELIGIVGPSGSGKSTLLELICGFEPLTCGEIKMDGDSLVDKLPGERAIGMVFQKDTLLPHMTVAENIAFGLKVRGERKQLMKEKVEAVAEQMGLTPYLRTKPGKLSGGQRQRVALARAMVRNPKLFLMDEPLSHLDAKLRDEMCVEIKALQEKLGVSMIYVTHDQVEAMTLADRIVLLKEGVIQQIGTPYELYHHPSNLFVAQFIGRPSINVLQCEWTNQTLIIEDEMRLETALTPKEHLDLETRLECILPNQDETENKKFTMALRGEAIKIVPQEEGHFKAEITKISFLGHETLIYLNYKKGILIAKDYHTIKYKVGSQVAVKLDFEQAHYFQ